MSRDLLQLRLQALCRSYLVERWLAEQIGLPLQYFRYARGIEVTSDDACAVHNLQLTFVESDLSIQDLLVAIVAQPTFAVRN